MINLAYIQKNNGEFINETAYTFWHGCQMLGIETKFFEAATFGANDFAHEPITRETLVHGHIGPVKKALRHLGISDLKPRVDGMPPESLLPFYGRNVWKSTMGEIRTKWAEDQHVFIKPLHVQKAFTGHVTSGRISDLIQTAGMPDEFEVLCSDPVEFIVEYRLYVHHGIIVDCRRYRGDYRRIVDIDTTAVGCVQAYTTAPVAYSLDLGLLVDGRTVIVEVNDAWALGNYGMPSIPYAQMVIDRWEQMVSL